MKSTPDFVAAAPPGAVLPAVLVPIHPTASTADPEGPSGVLAYGDLLTVTEVAALLRVHEDTLARWRRRRRDTGEAAGPTFILLGRAVRYRRQDIAEFISEAAAQ
ncbi:MAG: hypothetical protein B7X99_12130 [Rhizobiales bacterium 17-65-6]|nr:MAG: hypothetical protein B7Z30_00630 [Rhizobiales bacterium 12-68-15]OYZ98249.1 MAG: hypothetical protein B7X99_12130 [Rhizobiales bacterium 17-65-6]